ncbi:MAG TPA: type II toxin-antitoxin system MqsA family antitoxin [Chloroflexi bacterium]|nr:MAG: hypothetical protein B6243_02925 [Anaerolineaceae bacterium 4572_5.2]HEY85150.1 type II toxin-antitoxin system MqsA family antitoxin [Chloroflexota bacterium]
MDKCDLCGGELRSGRTTLEIRYKGELVIIEDVLADVCQQCGEAYLSAETSAQLDRFLSEHHRYKPERYIPVPQYAGVPAMG